MNDIDTNDFYSKLAMSLIGYDVLATQKLKDNVADGFTIGRMRIKRMQLQDLGITTSFQLESLRDALAEYNYLLIEPSFSEDFILTNIKILRNGSNTLDSVSNDSQETAMQAYFKYQVARNEIEKERKEQKAKNV